MDKDNGDWGKGKEEVKERNLESENWKGMRDHLMASFISYASHGRGQVACPRSEAQLTREIIFADSKMSKS